MVPVLWLVLTLLCATVTSEEIVGRPRSWATPRAAGPGGCPQGVPILTLPQAAQPSSNSSSSSGGATERVKRPYTFAHAAQADWDHDLTLNGTWVEGGDGSRTWQLCLDAPGAHSLTLSFRTLRLPLGADLFVYSPAATKGLTVCGEGCQRLSLHSARPDFRALTAPMPGDLVVLEYYQPSNARPSGATPVVELSSVLLGVQPLPFGARRKSEDVAEQVGDWGEAVANLSATTLAGVSSKIANLNPADTEMALWDAVNMARGGSATCQTDVNCDSSWAVEADAVVLLVGIDEETGFYCTATLINAPDKTQYLISANHCLGQNAGATMWGLLFDYNNNCRKDGQPSLQSSDVTYGLLQGLEIVWNDEVSDVMLMRLDDEIPSGYSPYFLGWDASQWVDPSDGVVCIHHPAGDYKMIAKSTLPVEQGVYIAREATHYVVTWTEGETQEGSSGSMLIDANSRLGMGPLTGGGEGTNCAGGEDFFASLYIAWKQGLGQYLGANGMSGPTKMEGRAASDDGPGLIVDPDLLVVNEGPMAAPLFVSLSDSPEEGEEITVQASIKGAGSPVTLSPAQLVFTADNWNSPQTISVIPGDDAVADGLQPFSVLLQLSSNKNSDLSKRRVVPGVRLDDETPEGSTPQRPMTIPFLPWKAAGSLMAAGGSDNSPQAPQVTLGETTLQEFAAAVPPGAAAYFSMDNAVTLDMVILACSRFTALRVVVFAPDGVATWSTATSCARDRADTCKSIEAKYNPCSGFQHLWMLGTNGAGPYILAVTSRDQEAANFTLEVDGKDGLT